MRYFFMTLVLLVVAWFGYGILSGKGKARAAGKAIVVAGEVLSAQPLEGGKASSRESPVPSPGAPSQAAPSSSREMKKAPSPGSTLGAALKSLEKSLDGEDLKAAARLVKGEASKLGGEPRFRALAMKAARKALDAGALERSARILTDLLDAWTRGPLGEKDLAELGKARELLGRVMNQLLWNPGGAWRSRTYLVKRRDVLERISRHFEDAENVKVTPGFIEAVNRVQAKRIRAGQSLRIPLGRLHVVVEKKSFVLKLFLDDVLIRIYRVGLGKNGKTPAARFTVELKQKNPVWWHPTRGPIPHGHPDNPLGNYFIKLKSDKYTGFGIHGTRASDKDTIGKEASQGCVRMLPQDVKELFSFLPKGAEVLIR